MERNDDIVVTLDELPATPIKPPRKRLLDLLPDWVAKRVRARWHLRPTPYEEWLVRSVLLRATFTGMYERFMRAPEPTNVTPITKNKWGLN